MGFNYVYTWQCCVTRAYYPCGVCVCVCGAGGLLLHTTTQDTHQVKLGADTQAPPSAKWTPFCQRRGDKAAALCAP